MKYAAVKELLCIVVSLCVYVSNKAESVVTFQEWKNEEQELNHSSISNCIWAPEYKVSLWETDGLMYSHPA